MPFRLRHLHSQLQCIHAIPNICLLLLQCVCHYSAGRARYSTANLGLQDFSMNYLGANNLAVYPSTVSGGQIVFSW
jgi:hypothetical protein